MAPLDQLGNKVV